MTTGTPPELAPPALASPPAARLAGIDLARGIAVLGILLNHLGGVSDERGWAAAVVRFTDGRALPVFVVVSGIGFGILVGRPRPHAVADVLGRAAVLLVAGLAFEGTTPVAVILQCYAAWFLLGLVVRRWRTPALAALTVAVVAAGAALTIWRDTGGAGSFAGDAGHWGRLRLLGRPDQLVSELMVTGWYPALPLFAFFLVGLWLSRRDLAATAVAVRLVVVGTVLGFGGAALGWFADGRAGSGWFSAHPASWVWDLLEARGHSNMPAWIVSATGVAVAVVGGSLVLARAVPRLVAPLAAVGELALTVYVGHLMLFRAGLDGWTSGNTTAHKVPYVLAAFVVLAVVCVLWRRRLGRGPLERLLRGGGWLGRRLQQQHELTRHA